MGARQECAGYLARPASPPAKLQLPEAKQSLIMSRRLQPAANTWLSDRLGPEPAKAVGEIVVEDI